MSTGMHEAIEQAVSRLKDYQGELDQVKRRLDEATATVTSKDRMVTVKVGSQGQVVDMTFHTNDYRQMAPSELGSALVKVLNEARAQIGEQVIEEYRTMQGVGETIGSALVGGTPFDDLLAPLREMRPGAKEEAEKRKRIKKQEAFDG
ncbi:YbaB/EbfC family nucleoid-associated protein [Streptomyces sp. NPDC048290]|uniref:YbaB/EbfC family nucleoid-associated protein n=1 Tax=Streptomyces sp. NPDC048290 TaxID=3155811 RepID=UPI003433304D